MHGDITAAVDPKIHFTDSLLGSAENKWVFCIDLVLKSLTQEGMKSCRNTQNHDPLYVWMFSDPRKLLFSGFFGMGETGTSIASFVIRQRTCISRIQLRVCKFKV